MTSPADDYLRSRGLIPEEDDTTPTPPRRRRAPPRPRRDTPAPLVDLPGPFDIENPFTRGRELLQDNPLSGGFSDFLQKEKESFEQFIRTGDAFAELGGARLPEFSALNPFNEAGQHKAVERQLLEDSRDQRTQSALFDAVKGDIAPERAIEAISEVHRTRSTAEQLTMGLTDPLNLAPAGVGEALVRQGPRAVLAGIRGAVKPSGPVTETLEPTLSPIQKAFTRQPTHGEANTAFAKPTIVDPTEAVEAKLLNTLKRAQQQGNSATRARARALELGKRASEGLRRAAQVSGEVKLAASRSAKSGPLPGAQFTPPELVLNQREKDLLFDKIYESKVVNGKLTSKLSGFDKDTAAEGLQKLLLGQMPQKNQITKLNTVFGPEMTRAIRNNRSNLQIGGEALLEGIGAIRAIATSIDFSAVGRQGFLLAVAHPRRGAKNIVNMVRASVSQKQYETIKASITTADNFDALVNPVEGRGVYMADIDGTSSALTQGEELFATSLFERLGAFNSDFRPLKNLRAAQKVKLRGRQLSNISPLEVVVRGLAEPIRASNRAYVTFLNKMRFDVANDAYTKWQVQLGFIDKDGGPGWLIRDLEDAKEGVTDLAENVISNVKPTAQDPFARMRTVNLARKADNALEAAQTAHDEAAGELFTRAEGLARWVNRATGRGTLGSFEKMATELNTVFFAPRLVVSRFQVPLSAFERNKHVRNMVWKDLAAYGATVASILAIMDANPLFGKNVTVETDTRSSDWAKVKIGPTRLDFLSGWQPLVRYISQATSNQRKSVVTGEVHPIGVRKRNRNPDGTLEGEVSHQIKARSKGATDVFGRLLRSKLAPVPAASVDTIAGADFLGDEINPRTYMERVIPLIIQDIDEGMNSGGYLHGGLSASAGIGVGVVSYRTVDDVAQELYPDPQTGEPRNYIDLQPHQQMDVRDIFQLSRTVKPTGIYAQLDALDQAQDEHLQILGSGRIPVRNDDGTLTPGRQITEREAVNWYFDTQSYFADQRNFLYGLEFGERSQENDSTSAHPGKQALGEYYDALVTSSSSEAVFDTKLFNEKLDALEAKWFAATGSGPGSQLEYVYANTHMRDIPFPLLQAMKNKGAKKTATRILNSMKARDNIAEREGLNSR